MDYYEEETGPVSKNKYNLQVGDKVKIGGDISRTRAVVNVPDQMYKIINNGKEYKVRQIKIGNKGKYIVHAGEFWWSIDNIVKMNVEVIKNPTIATEIKEPVLFDLDHLSV